MTIRHVKASVAGVGAALLVSIAMGHAQGSSGAAGSQAGSPRGQANANGGAMMANMQAEQKRLDDLVAAMNATTRPDKVERIAAVVNELAAMHKRMSMMMMQGEVMRTMPGTAPQTQPAAPAGPDHSGHHAP